MDEQAHEDGIVIVGAGLAGGKAAQTLREEGFTGPVTLVGSEPERPYERPPLSKGYLQGSDERDSVFVHPADWYEANQVDLLTGTTAVAVDPSAGVVALDDGRELSFGRLLLATGSRPRLLDVPGAHLEGVRYLRTLADSEALREALGRASSVAIIGGGWIGSEVASAARALGLPVTVLEMAELPLLRVLGPAVAGIFADLHRRHGVVLRTGVRLAALHGSNGHLSGVELGDGTRVEADLAVVGVGILPNTELAAAAGLHVDNGIVTDEHLGTSHPAVWAAGDVASAYHPILKQHLRMEHWNNALLQGPAAARSILGAGRPYDELPFFYTDQYDWGMEYVGHASGQDRVILRGDVAAGHFVALWVSQGRVRAGMHVNDWDATDHLRALVGREVAGERLADESVPLAEL